MSQQDIIAIIKWGPVLLFLLVFLFGLIVGMIKGNRKVIRRLVYVVIYTVLIFIFLPTITNTLMDMTIGGMSVKATIDDFIVNNETLNDIYNKVPGLEQVILQFPGAILSLVLFFVLMVVGLPLSFPIYWLFMAIYALISKLVFRYSRFERDETGDIVRNEKGKKVKKKKKYRVVAGVIKGVQYVLITSIVLTPFGVITRIYKAGKEATDEKDLSSISYLENFGGYLEYVDAYNEGFIGFATDNPLNKALAAYLTQMEINGNKTNAEKELTTVVEAAVYIEQSGLIELLSGNLDIKTLDLTKLNLDKMDKAIELLFDSGILDGIVSDGVNYVLESYLNETLVKFTKDQDIVSKIKYSNSKEVKNELLQVTSLLRSIINAKLLETYRDSNNNYVQILNTISTKDVETILNKVLSVQILSKAMPSVVTNLLDDYGLKEELTTANNSEFVDLVLDVVVLAKTLEIESLNDITEGDMFTNIVDTLYVEGVLKTNTIDALAELLARATSSRVFDDILITQLNKILKQYDINLNSQMIVNVNTKADWKNELLILEDICKLYKDYKTNATVDFLTVNELMSDLKETKAMILAFPIAYKTLFPTLGIEIDPNKIVYVDYQDPNVLTEEEKFYNYWKGELVHLETVSAEFAKLGVTRMEDISLDLLKIEANEATVANILAEVFSMDSLKDGVVTYLDKMISDMLVQYEVTLNDGAIANVNNLINEYPKYVVVDGIQYNVNSSNIYYVDENPITVTDEEIHDNTLNRIWLHEVGNLADVVNTLTAGNITEKENISTILNSVDSMHLLKDVKNDLLIYAIGQANVLNETELQEVKDKKNTLDFTKEKDILINVIEKKDTINTLSNIVPKDLTDEQINDIDYLLDNILSSDIFSNKVVSSMVSVFNSANIKHDEDTSDNSNLEGSIRGVTDWSKELNLIKEMTNITSSDQISNELFTKIESSELLGGCKNNIMIAMVKTVNDNLGSGEIKLTVPTVGQLKEVVGESTQYEYEKELILDISKVENVNFDSLDNSTIETIAPVLNKMNKSIIFSLQFTDLVESMATSLNDANIYHDEEVGDNVTLKETIRNISDWEKELKLINSLKDIDSSSEVTTELFTKIENSEVLGECKYNVMISMVHAINDSSTTDVNLRVPTVSELNTPNQYLLEKTIIVNVSNLESINMDNMTEGMVPTVAPMLENMQKSVIFTPKYNEFVDKLVDGITDTTYGVTATNREVDDWTNELNALIAIKDSIKTIGDVNKDTDGAAYIIAELLSNMDNSVLIDDTSSQNAANKIVTDLTADNIRITSIEKNVTWAQTFNDLIDTINGGNE